MNQTRSSNRSFVVLFVVVAALSLSLGLWLSSRLNAPAGPEDVPPGMDATVLPQPRPLAHFTLTDHRGQPFGLEQLQGNWSFLFFGYTNCPDVCPMTLAVMAGVFRELEQTPEDLADAQLVFVSVDPQRDDLDQLGQYVGYFNPAFVGVTGEPDAIDGLTRQLGVLYGFEDGSTEADYVVNHSAQVLLIDPQARLRAVFSTPHLIETISKDFRQIRRFYEG